MIYSMEECNIIKSILHRKELERSIYSAMESLSLSFKSAMDCQLELDIQRCHSM